MGISSKYSVVCISSTKASFSANLLWLGGVVSVGNLTPGSSKGCRTLHLQPKFFRTSSSINKEGSCRLLSPDSLPSRGGTCVHPLETLCTPVHGLQVVVAAGLEGDPLGRKYLGLPVSAPVVVVVVEVVGIVDVIAGVEISKGIRPVVVIGTSSGSPIDTTQFCPFPRAKKWLADARTSSWLASLILWTLLGISAWLALCLSDIPSDITITEV